jgi:hypothetical protein
MSRMLLVVFAASTVTAMLACRAEPVREQVVGNTSLALSQFVFIGKDKDIPKRGDFRFALDLPHASSGAMQIPVSSAEAVVLLERAIPRWMAFAMARSFGEQDCDVYVNDVSYWRLAFAAAAESWNLSDSSTQISRDLARDANSRELDMISDHLRAVLCKRYRDTFGSLQ